MRKLASAIAFVTILALISTDCHAQRGGRRGGGGDGGGELGGRGGRGGGGERGGRPGGGGALGGAGRGGERGGIGGGDRGGAGGTRGGGGDRGGFGGGRGGGGDRSSFNPGARLDSDGDGRISQQEYEKMPETFRSRLDQMGIKPGISVDEFGTQIRAGFEQMRSQREAEARGESPQGDDRAGSNRNLNSRGPFRASKKERVTVDLPPKYSDLDVDFDGQLGLYEWMVAKRDSLDQFDEMDLDLDGLLTPVELKFFDDVVAIASGQKQTTSTPKRERLLIIGPGGSRTSIGGAGGSSKPVVRQLSEKERESQIGKSKYYFDRMDKNKNGTLEPEEFDKDRLVPWFEKAGVAVRTMSKDEFGEAFVSAVERTETSSTRGGGDRGERGGDRGGDRGGRGGDRGGDRRR